MRAKLLPIIVIFIAVGIGVYIQNHYASTIQSESMKNADEINTVYIDTSHREYNDITKIAKFIDVDKLKIPEHIAEGYFFESAIITKLEDYHSILLSYSNSKVDNNYSIKICDELINLEGSKKVYEKDNEFIWQEAGWQYSISRDRLSQDEIPTIMMSMEDYNLIQNKNYRSGLSDINIYDSEDLSDATGVLGFKPLILLDNDMYILSEIWISSDNNTKVLNIIYKDQAKQRIHLKQVMEQ